LIKRILDPDPEKRITMAGIKEDPWFKKGYVPANPEDEDVYVDNEVFSIHEEVLYLCPCTPLFFVFLL